VTAVAKYRAEAMPDYMRCRATTRHNNRKGLRCGNVAVLWPVGGNLCLKHGGYAPAYFERWWRVMELEHRRGPLVYESPAYTRYKERICFEHYDRWREWRDRRGLPIIDPFDP